MKTYSFVYDPRGTILTAGISLVRDEKLGQVVFLGQSGPKGARWEKVSLDRKAPAEVIGGKVLEADPVKITLPPRDGKPEKTFFVLARPKGMAKDGAVLVRIKCQGVYTRGTYGSWRKVEGDPEGLVAGTGSDTETTKTGSWSDGLVVMRPGDVVKMTLSGGSKFRSYALYFDAAGSLTTADFEAWQAGQAVAQAQAVAQGGSQDLLYGLMPIYSFGSQAGGWGVSLGVETTALPGGGRGFTLGPRGGGWRISEKVTVAVADDLPLDLEEAAVAQVGDRTVLVNSTKVETGKFMVRVDTDGLRKRGRTAAMAIRENPALLTEGWMEIGTANVEYHADQLWVLAEGDVLRIGQEYTEYFGSDYVLYVKDEVVEMERLHDWALREARRDPSPFIAEGWCPVDCLPAAWVGQVVEPADGNRDSSHGPYMLKAIQPVVFQGGWDALKPEDRFTVGVGETVWVHLRTDLKAEAPIENLKTSERVSPRLQPRSDGVRFEGQVTTFGEGEAWRGGPKVFKYEVKAMVEADVYEVTSWTKDGESRKEEKPLGVRLIERTFRPSSVILGSGQDRRELYGEFRMAAQSGRRDWSLVIHDEEKAEAEIVAMQGTLEREAAQTQKLWAWVVEKDQSDESWRGFEFGGKRFVLDRNPNAQRAPAYTTLHEGYVGADNAVSLQEAYRSGLLKAWAQSLGYSE